MLKKTCLLLTCAVVSLAYANNAKPAEPSCKPVDCKAADANKPTECVVSEADLKKMEEIAVDFQKLEVEFKKWGVATIWDQVRGKNSNVVGGQATGTVAYGLFANAKNPTFAVTAGKFVSADPKLDNQDATGAEHIKKMQAALKDSKDGKVVVEYKRMEKNPADNDGPMIEANIKAVAWDQRAFDLKDGDFFVFRELRG